MSKNDFQAQRLCETFWKLRKFGSKAQQLENHYSEDQKRKKWKI